ncbi:DUF1217 domain-containing protein [Jiella marina]|uniref:DUF1217 domain-containing protein n=1 Tax=Jiella sp. LLJ827 TaxID=2917712 RepID=UPI002100DF5D|nr:DUF1217 domain-containing protein [Jiella sp. LLJ827]MCQ0988350.1 DUF1217 domain-containing protein [Jiella sp. LLJ827]
MLSTFLTYQLYTRDQSRVIDRIASDPVNKRLSEYYRENIQNVTSVDEFMDDYRLYSYAMTAYGLEGQIDSRALIRKVLESDLADPQSFANQLSDERYRDFAKAFSFAAASEEPELVAQTNAQRSVMVDGYSQHQVKAATALSANANYFMANVGSINDVDDFLADEKLFAVALEAAGIDSTVASESFIRDVLTGTMADKMAAKGDTRYLLLAAMLPFETDGSVPDGGLMSEAEANSTAYLYYTNRGAEASPQAAALQVDYYEATIGSVESADDLIENPRLLNVALTSVGLDPSIESKTYVWQMLTSDQSDPDSALNRMSEATTELKARKQQYMALARMFDFDTMGNVVGDSAQTAENVEKLTGAYLDNYYDAAAQDDRLSATLYAAHLSSIQSVVDFIGDSTVYNYALKAVGLDPATESRSTIMRVLRSDPSDPKSFARKLDDDRYVRLAAAFNFGADGKLADVRRLQTEDAQGATIERFLKKVEDEDDLDLLTDVIEQSQVFKSSMNSISNIDEFLASDAALDYAMKAIGFNPDTQDPNVLRNVLTSDLSDPESYANRLGIPQYIKLAEAFDVDSYGNLSLASDEAGNLRMMEAYYDKVLGDTDGQLANAARGVMAYNEELPKIATIEDFLSNQTLTRFALEAYGLENEKLTADDIRAILTSDPSNSESVAAKYGDDRYLEFAAAYNFDTDGTIKRDVNTVQTVTSMLTTQDYYLRQRMEEEAGAENGGVRLALYFKRQAEEISNVYEFLADDALLKFALTSLGLPSEFSSADIDVQARTLEKKIDVEQLSDTRYVERMVNRFLAMYDIENGGGSAPNPALTLLSGSAPSLL